ncbi:RNA recognition motif domain-containing protein [Sediminispirochaeta smaragdinae]|jgi:RNA recognition motif-containing protein|uniref:RNP-1 like RNA-binding protein n=1 Tax=Sediminispirochaeta smaragdinae (strain DSM 11293 / JCM 15392 / SEBR 4228) TaxID=573413 RepID=E1R9C5_SEDSS|nr:RNA-binding protein [Sediminispirochaeta smaragdinae]ADK83094.1 RNP-1 like RNA-binding protein [Sediminispirochaeta smaragdinae DSM 11293]
MSKKIYVGNLSYEAREEDLESLFSQYGSVSSVRIITDRDTNRSKGFGFVEMEDSSAADAAISALNGTEWKNRDLKVNEARDRNDRPQRGGYRY